VHLVDLEQGETLPLRIGDAPWLLEFALAPAGNVAIWTYAREIDGQHSKVNGVWAQFLG
jgi:hypothetical protein